MSPLIIHHSPVTDVPYSSQSVARLNTSWSNDPKMGPRALPAGKRSADGYGGRHDLEKTRRYRDADEGGGGRHGQEEYGMVFDVPGDKPSARRRRSRSRE